MLEVNTYNFDYNSNNEIQLVKQFKSFQRQYLVVYLTVMGSDWLQGPYLYKLYDSYGLKLTQIAMLFLTGFISSAFAGTVVGGLADTWGRKRVCLVFCWTMLVSLTIRLINIYPILCISHALSGLSTALLYSVFESWYVSEHTSRGFPADWRARTFGLGTLLNSIVAILAGITANVLVELWGFRAPYIGSMILISLVATMVMTTWTENYGSNQTDIKLVDTLSVGIATLLKNRNIIIIGIAQTLFECAMYIFVLLYTPALENAISNTMELSIGVPLGYLFSTMMLAVMAGSLTFQVIEIQAIRRTRFWLKLNEAKLLSLSLGLAFCSFMMMAYHGNTPVTLLLTAYHIFEFTTGLYYPSVSSLKANVIPEETRAAVMALLRIPMNLAVGVLMWHVDDMSSEMLFSICGVMTCVGCLLLVTFYR